MKKHLFAAAIFFVASRADCQEYYDKARDAANSARSSSIHADGAAQVSQLHNQAQTEIQTALVKQGDNNLKMAEGIKGELEALRKETGTLVKYLGISLAVGLVAIWATLAAIYFQLSKTATRDSDNIYFQLRKKATRDSDDKIADNTRSSGEKKTATRDSDDKIADNTRSSGEKSLWKFL